MKLLQFTLFYFLICFIFQSCFNLDDKNKNSFCSWNSAEDYQRIPLLRPAELIRLNGDTFWSFPFERSKIKNLNVSDPMNIIKIGINKNGFILITDSINHNENNSYPTLIKVDKTISNNLASIYYTNKQIDSIYNLNVSKYKWYNVKDIWNEFEKTGFIPWCE